MDAAATSASDSRRIPFAHRLDAVTTGGIVLLSCLVFALGFVPPSDTVRVEVGSPDIDGAVYQPHAARVRTTDGSGRIRTEWTNTLTIGDSAGRKVHRWVTAGYQLAANGDTVRWELRQTYDARTLAPYGIVRTTSTGASSALRIDGRHVTGVRRPRPDAPAETVDFMLDRPGFVGSASDLVPGAAQMRPGLVIIAPVWSATSATTSESRSFTIVGKEPVKVEQSTENAWRVEERRVGDAKLLATWFLTESAPYMVAGEVPLADGSVQRYTEIALPRP
jgi:hypothetical protein